MKYLIIGGVAGGATAAARIRRIDEFSEIIIFEKGSYISYANCGLPYYIGGVIADREKLLLQTPSSFKERFNIDVRVDSEVIDIDTKRNIVTVRNNDNTLYTERYDKLLLSPGATPIRPPLDGLDSDGIFTLRNVDDTDRIKKYVTTNKIENAVVVGGGFIGLEMAENLHILGADISIVQMENQVMTPVDFSIASHIHHHIQEKGVSLHLEQTVDSFKKVGNKIEVYFKSGGYIVTDMVILSIGVRPATSLAVSAGIKIGETGGIWVDDYLETSVKDIYAVGDAIEFPHPITQKPWLNYLANPANRQGRIVADNMVLGNIEKYEGAIGTAIAKVFEITVATTGLTAKSLKRLNIEYRSSTTHSTSHAGYYPDALSLTIKLTFDPHSGRLYGGQCVGYDGVDKRIDQIALIIKNRGTIYDLMRVEHAYAPPFSSAKDPIAIAGYVANNIVNGVMSVINWRDIDSCKDVLLLDVRTSAEYSFGSISGAVNIPLDELRGRIDEIPTDKDVYLFCAVGLRAYLAIKILTARGFKNVKNLSGGYKTYSIATAPTKTVITNSTIMETDIVNISQSIKTVKIDACGLQCPGPIMKVKGAIDSVEDGDRVEIISTDVGFSRDAKAWCASSGNQLISNSVDKGRYTVVIEKGGVNTCNISASSNAKGKTIVMFSDDLDKALATFVLANGAVATGQKTTIFFTFWGLNTIKKESKPRVKKDIFGKMFQLMLPSSSLRLSLSKMSMFGIGDRMMRHIMSKKGVDSLESLRQQAIDNGVEFIACQMSMDIMGVKRDELLDEVTIGGVATYMERAENANVNLFI